METFIGADNERTYHRWLIQNPRGLVHHQESSQVFMLHQCDCIHIGVESHDNITRAPKHCSTNKYELNALVRERTGSPPARCPTCAPDRA